ncbi:hypothetical protein ACFQVC_35645 [Streptomyces monticola]|uniref:Uncharacterized protein n=1 Tax=Streptomyces monticola TaxID=2666263 RepID=A0ABW2JVZ2_9ACTN
MYKTRMMTAAGIGIAALGLSVFGASAASAAPVFKADDSKIQVVDQKTGKTMTPAEVAKATGGKVTVSPETSDKSTQGKKHAHSRHGDPKVVVVDQKTGKTMTPAEVAKATGGKVTVTTSKSGK